MAGNNFGFVNLFLPFLWRNLLYRDGDGISSGTDDVHDILHDSFCRRGFFFFRLTGKHFHGYVGHKDNVMGKLLLNYLETCGKTFIFY
jgi:hypothetical protein